MPWVRGKCLAWDFTCPDTLAASHMDKAVVGPGQVANDAEQKKIDKYTKLSTHYQFVPIAIKTLGPVGDETIAFFHERGRRIVAVTSEPRTMSFLWQRMRVAVQQMGNATCITGMNIGHMTRHSNLYSN